MERSLVNQLKMATSHCGHSEDWGLRLEPGRITTAQPVQGEAIDTKIIAVLGPGFVATSENTGIKKTQQNAFRARMTWPLRS